MQLWSYVHFFCFITFVYVAVYVLLRNWHEPVYQSMFLVLTGMALWSIGKMFMHNQHSSFRVASIASAVEFFGTHLTVLSVPWYFRLQIGYDRNRIVKVLESVMVVLFLGMLLVYVVNFYSVPGSIVVAAYGWKQHFLESDLMLPLIPLYIIGYAMPAFYLSVALRKKTVAGRNNPVKGLFIVLTLIYAGSLFFTYGMPLIAGTANIPEAGNVLALSWAFVCPLLVRKYSTNLEPLTAADTLIENLPDPLFISDSNGRVLRLNRAGHKLFGFPDITGGKTLFELLPSGSVDVKGDLQRIGSTRFDTRVKTMTGKIQDFSVSVSPILDIRGGIDGTISIAHDISERKLLENRLLSQAEVLAHSNSELESSRKNLSVTLHKMEQTYKLMKSDLDAARHMQKLLLPNDFSVYTGVRMASLFKPSESVGGDLFSVCKMANGGIAIVVFDVAGHGVAAALYAAVAKTVFERRIDPAVSPGETLRKVNEDLYQALGGELFLASFIGHIIPESMMMTYALTTFPFPILFRKMAGESVLLSGRGAFVGMSADDNALTFYEDNCIFMEHGDRFIVYTDGITEARREDGTVWGNEKLKTAFTESLTLPIPAAIQKIIEQQERFCEGLVSTDDRTILMVEMV
jgi:PAS domain S-box-containing protein